MSKEEPKQETLEEATERIFPIKLMYFPKEVIDLNEEPRNIFFNGAKWQQDNSNINALNFEIDALKKQIELLNYQQERMYSEEEIIKILIEYDYSKINDDKLNSVGIVKKWFKQFKKK